MSAQLRLTDEDLTQLAGFLTALTEATREHDITIGPYSPPQLQVGETVIAFEWDEDGRRYVLSDRVGD